MRLGERLLGNPGFPRIRLVAVLPQSILTRPHPGRTGGDREMLQMGKTKSPQQAAGLNGWRGSALAVVLAVMLAGAPSAEATFGGRNGALLVAVRHGTRIGPAAGLLPNPRFGCGTGDLWSLRSDGTHPRWVGRGDNGLFSPDGRRLAISVFGGGCSSNPGPPAGVYLARADGSRSRRISGASLIGWVGTHVVAVRPGRGRLNGRDVVIDALTNETITLIPAGNSYIAISCSGRIAIPEATSTGAVLRVLTRTRVRVGGRVRIRVVSRNVISTTTSLGPPSWSPDGTRLMFGLADMATRFSQSGGLWSIGANGDHLQRLTPQSLADDYYPIWSPDGRQVIFFRYGAVPGMNSEMIMNADGSAPRVLPVDGSGGVWSPDGRSLAFGHLPPAPQPAGVVIVDAATGATRTMVPLAADGGGAVDWQARGPQRQSRCLDHHPVPIP